MGWIVVPFPGRFLWPGRTRLAQEGNLLGEALGSTAAKQTHRLLNWGGGRGVQNTSLSQHLSRCPLPV